MIVCLESNNDADDDVNLVGDASRSNAFDTNSFSGFVDVSLSVADGALLLEATAAAYAALPFSPVAMAVAVATADVDDNALKEATEADKGSVLCDFSAANRFDGLSAALKSSVLCR